MRRLGLSALASIVVFAVVPANALARHHHHHARSHHARKHFKFFGSATTPTTTTTTPTDTAGTVTSFDGTTLVITLNNGSTVSGVVTSDTEIDCEAPESTSSTPTTSTNNEDGDTGGGTGGTTGGTTGGGDQGDQGGDGGDGGSSTCTTANLTANTVVQEAELGISSTGATWQNVDLIVPGASSD
jgi:hypothetical protein